MNSTNASLTIKLDSISYTFSSALLSDGVTISLAIAKNGRHPMFYVEMDPSTKGSVSNARTNIDTLLWTFAPEYRLPILNAARRCVSCINPDIIRDHVNGYRSLSNSIRAVKIVVDELETSYYVPFRVFAPNLYTAKALVKEKLIAAKSSIFVIEGTPAWKLVEGIVDTLNWKTPNELK